MFVTNCHDSFADDVARHFTHVLPRRQPLPPPHGPACFARTSQPQFPGISASCIPTDTLAGRRCPGSAQRNSLESSNDRIPLAFALTKFVLVAAALHQEPRDHPSLSKYRTYRQCNGPVADHFVHRNPNYSSRCANDGTVQNDHHLQSDRRKNTPHSIRTRRSAKRREQRCPMQVEET